MNEASSKTEFARAELLAALDAAYAAVAQLDCRLVTTGMRSWCSPRQHVIDAFTGLQRTRDALREIGALPDLAAQFRDDAAVVDAPQAPGGETRGPGKRGTATGDADRGPSAHNDLAQGDSTATAQPRQARSTEADPHHSGDQVASTSAHTKPQGHERIVVRLDVQTRTGAKSATAREQGERADAGGGLISSTTD